MTGATGFVGSFLIDRLLTDGWNVVALARGSNPAARVRAALAEGRGGPVEPAADSRLRVVHGDVRDPALGLSAAGTDSLADAVDEIWHCAANFGSEKGGDNPASVNVGGTRNVLALAAAANLRRRVPFHHVSTAFAADSRGGLALEEVPGPGGMGRNSYEASKREAERIILEWHAAFGIPVAIFRPSIILGHARTGRASGFAAYYDFLRSLCVVARAGRPGAVPAAPLRVRTRSRMRVNLVTIDFVIDAMLALARAPRGEDVVFNLVNENSTEVGTIIREMCRSIGMDAVELADAASFAEVPMTRLERMFHAMIEFEQPYLEGEVRFDSRRFRRLVPVGDLPAPRITVPLLRRINLGYLEYRARQAECAARAAGR